MKTRLAYWQALGKNPRAFERMTGLKLSQFEALAEKIAPRFEAAQTRRLTRRERKRGLGAGGRYKLCVADQLLLTLIYYRTYITHVMLGFLFGIDDSNTCRCVRRMGPLLAQEFRIPERRIRLEEGEITTLFLTPRSVRFSAPAA